MRMYLAREEEESVVDTDVIVGGFILVGNFKRIFDAIGFVDNSFLKVSVSFDD